MAHRASILLCDDDELYLRTLALGLGDQFHVECVASGGALLHVLRKSRPDVLLLDLCFGALEAGFDLIEEVLALRPGLPIVVHSGLDDYAAIVRAMQLGASTYVPKHSGIDALSTALRQQLARVPAQDFPDAAGAPVHFLGSSAAARQVRAALSVFARSEGHVLVTGDAGVGKRVAAHALFQPGRPWVELAGAAAENDVAIAVASSRGGCLFVDSLTDCPLPQQRALWRALDRQTRTGAGKPAQPCRVVTTARGNLAELRVSSLVCPDLLARLAVLVLPVPGLIARREDLAGLVAHFGAERGAQQRSQVSRDVLDALLGYGWPGNVRELANAVQYMHAMAAGQPVERRHLPPEVRVASGHRLGAPTPPGAAAGTDLVAGAAAANRAEMEDAGTAGSSRSFRRQCRDFEREILRRAYEAAGGHIATMSQALELNRTYLYEKLRAYRIVGR